MACYWGGKQRQAPTYAKIIHSYDPDCKYAYFEPFCGGCSVAKSMYILGNNKRQIYLNDISPDLILLLNAIRNNVPLPYTDDVLPDEIYKKYRSEKEPSLERAVCGYLHTFSGAWFQGLAKFRPDGRRKYFAGRLKNWLGLHNLLQSAQTISCESYINWNPVNCIIYCDPPYGRRTKKYQHVIMPAQWNRVEFWSTMNKWSESNLVFVSEFCNNIELMGNGWETVSMNERDMQMRPETKTIVEWLFMKGKLVPENQSLLTSCMHH